MTKKTLIFATNNQHKVAEIKFALNNQFDIVTLKEAGITIDIPEPHDTFEANASEKSTTIFRLTQKDCFGEDTGLQVECLNGEPGVKSARYAGDGGDFKENIEKLLHNMEGCTNRNAQFKTVIALVLKGKEYFFEGICTGTITKFPIGSNGFGYDSVFVPSGANITFAEMSLIEKSAFSHRKKALDKLISFLTKN
jgi:XTP/dITP diphosphohydrolase